MFTLPGMPVMYYGEELGMADVRPIPVKKIHDTKELRTPGFGRDPVRTPMQWNSSTYAGFSEVVPWLPLEKDYKEKNVASESKDPSSMLHLYKTLLKLRAEHNEVFVRGEFQTIQTNNAEIFAYERTTQNATYYVYVNFSDKNQQCELVSGTLLHQIVSSVQQTNRGDTIYNTLELKPFEAIVLRNE
jgi:alpha-glucosidase